MCDAAGMRQGSRQSRSRRSGHWLRLLPWLIAISLLALLIGQASPVEIARSTRGARLEFFLPLVAVACGVWFLLESATLAMLFRRFNRPPCDAPLSWSEARSARGLTYLLTPIHWNVGRAGLVLHLKHSKGIPILDAASSLLYQQTIDAWLLVGCAGLGLAALPPSPEYALMARSCGVLFIAITLLCVLLALPTPRWSWLARLHQIRLLRTHRLARPADFLALALLRSAYYAVFILVYAGGTAAFGIDLPLALVMASVPIIQLVGSIPITPAGLGTQQAAMLILFSGHGPEPAIIAFGLAFPLVQTAARCLIGLFYLPRALPRALPGLRHRPDTPSEAPRGAGSALASLFHFRTGSR